MSWSAPTLTHMQKREGFGLRWLLWVQPRDRTTYAIVPFGVWNDVVDAQFTIDSVSRTYYAAYGSFVPPSLTYEKGLTVQEIEIGFHHVNPAIKNVLLNYETSNAPMELHRVLYDNAGTVLEIERKFKGFVSRFPVVVPEINGAMTGTLHCVSSARMGTRTVGSLKSDTAQRRRSSTDAFRLYGSLSNVSSDFWGNKG